MTTPKQDAETLKARLDDGWRKIDEAKDTGTDTRGWEDLWLSILHEYESACDQITQSPLAGMEGRRWTSG